MTQTLTRTLPIFEENMQVTYGLHPLFIAGQHDLLQELPAFGGYDLGRSAHPAHFSVLLPGGRDVESMNRLYQVASVWFPIGTKYITQLDTISELIHLLRIKYLCYDNTREEFEVLREDRNLPPQMRGIKLVNPLRSKMAEAFNFDLDNENIDFLLDEWQEKSIYAVDTLLKAEQSEHGHGDAFWSNVLAHHAFLLPPHLIEPAMFRTRSDVRSERSFTFLSVKFDLGDESESAGFCIGVWDCYEEFGKSHVKNFHLYDYLSGPYPQNEQLRFFKEAIMKHNPLAVSILEDQLKFLPEELFKGGTPIPLKLGDLREELAMLQPMIAASQVSLSQELKNPELFVNQICQFPQMGQEIVTMAILGLKLGKDLARMKSQMDKQKRRY